MHYGHVKLTDQAPHDASSRNLTKSGGRGIDLDLDTTSHQPEIDRNSFPALSIRKKKKKKGQKEKATVNICQLHFSLAATAAAAQIKDSGGWPHRRPDLKEKKDIANCMPVVCVKVAPA